MVTIRPGTYRGPLFIELRGNGEAMYYDEGKNTFTPFGPGEVLRAVVPAITGNIGITPFSEAAYRLLTEGDTPERASGKITAEQIKAANNRVRDIINQQFPTSIQIADLTRLPILKSDTTPPGTVGVDAQGTYSLITGAFSKQAAMFNPAEASPTLTASKQLGDDLLDGHLDGMRSGQPIAAAHKRTYDPNTWASELSSALSQQSERFGTGAAIDAMPVVTNFGSTRYETYLFDAKLTPSGQAINTVAGWDGANDKNRSTGESRRLLPTIARFQSLHGNLGNGSLFLKSDSDNSNSKLYALGDNSNGELGTGTREPNITGVEVNLPGTMTHIAGGFGHTVARLADGSVYAWGDNSYGQLGQGLPSAQLVRSETPRKVNLPRGAIAVAASNVASYALLDDGSVYSWGSSWGFGLLGDGTKDGVRLSPAAVLSGSGALSGVVQISARDNDAVALRSDGSVVTWGSFPIDESGGFSGGRQVATPVVGLPAPSAERIRKILTEQGLFIAQTTNGAVYHWGIHFDITAQGILRDTTAVRVLNLPPVRDIMPGGFLGYGERPSDRVTGMGIDPNGNLWKIRGRVAELFDPANPTAQRRPKSQEPRRDCSSCHGVLPTWPIKAPAPTSTAACVLPTFKLGPSGSPILVNSSTECTMCHNGNPRPFLDCVIQPLPERVAPSVPPIASIPCQLPTNHVATSGTTVCASCHNSVVTRPLSCLPNVVTDPLAPTIRAAISTVLDDAIPGTGSVPSGGVTNDPTPTINGTLSAALVAGQSVQVLRNGQVAGSPAVNGLAWSFTDSTQPQGGYTYTARVVQAGRFGAFGNAHSITIDTAVPSATITTMNLVADSGPAPGVIPVGVATIDSTPLVQGTLSAALASGESVRILRGGTDVGAATVSGSGFNFVSPPLSDGTYTFGARVVDTAGNISSSREQTLVVNTTTTLTPPATVSISGVVDNVTPTVATLGNGATTNDDTPTLQGTVSRTLSTAAGERVRIYRAGAAAADVNVTGTSWSYTPTLTDGSYTFSAQVVDSQGRAGALINASTFRLTVDRQTPVGATSLAATDDAAPGTGSIGTTTNDNAPRITISLSAPLGSGESFVITRALGGGTAAALGVVPTISGISGRTYVFDDTLSLGFAAASTPSPVDSPTQSVGGVRYTGPALPSTFAPLSVQYAVRLVDLAGNTSALQTLGFTLDYPLCVPLQPQGHSPRTDCAGCHRAGNGFVMAPPGPVPSYWCRYPG